jgi:hypothetical protein
MLGAKVLEWWGLLEVGAVTQEPITEEKQEVELTQHL